MINIRHAIEKDIPMIEEIYFELYSLMADLQPDFFQKAQQHRPFLEEMILSTEAALFIAESNNECLGFIVVHQQKTPPYVAIIPRNYAYIIDLAVTEKSRGLGIGTLLLDAADQWAKARNLDYLELGVLENNLGAKKLYEKLGFESMSTIMRRKLS